ncbi:MAG: hypothetical protein ACUVRZ_06855 [Desulfobacca sp.]|uniref:hypothetical protein n=1 Tax=Desulfobacca sp. TaxID=2067990 RepID=UPI004049BAC8
MDYNFIPDNTKLTPQMTLLEIMYRWRASEAVFRAYESQAGVCLRCQALFDSLEDVAQKYRLDLQALLADLQALIHTLPPEPDEP